MAQDRIFQIRGMKIGGTAVGGLQDFSFAPGFANTVLSTPDGALGVEEIDGSALQMVIAVTATDFKDVMALLATVSGELTLEVGESGAVTTQTKTLAGIAWHTLAMNFPRHADASWVLTGEVQFSLAEAVLGTIWDTAYVVAGGVTKAGAGFPQTFPQRVYRPNTMTFDPTGGGAAFPVNHLVSVNATLAARVLRDEADADAGISAIDIVDWQPVQYTITIRDASIAAARNMAAKLFLETDGKLAFNLKGRSSGADDELTFTGNGVKFMGYGEAISNEYANYTLNAQGLWTDSVQGQAHELDGTTTTGIMNIE